MLLFLLAPIGAGGGIILRFRPGFVDFGSDCCDVLDLLGEPKDSEFKNKKWNKKFTARIRSVKSSNKCIKSEWIIGSEKYEHILNRLKTIQKLRAYICKIGRSGSVLLFFEIKNTHFECITGDTKSFKLMVR